MGFWGSFDPVRVRRVGYPPLSLCNTHYHMSRHKPRRARRHVACETRACVRAARRACERRGGMYAAGWRGVPAAGHASERVRACESACLRRLVHACVCKLVRYNLEELEGAEGPPSDYIHWLDRVGQPQAASAGGGCAFRRVP